MFRVISSAKSAIKNCRSLSTSAGVTEYTSLHHGVTVASEANPLAKSSTIGIWIGAGSKYENPYNNGITKVLADAVVSSVKDTGFKQGAIVNASVGKEYLGLYGTSAASDSGAIIKLLSSAVASLKESAVEEAKKSATRATEIVEDTPKLTVLEHLHATAFQKTPLSLPTFGTPESISNIEVSDIESFVAKQFVSSNVVVVGAGNISHEALVDQVEKLVKVPEGLAPTLAPTKFLGSELRFRDDTMDSAYISIAVDGPAYNSADYYTALVASEILGQYVASEPSSFYQASKLANFVHENHLAQSFNHFSLGYKNAGLWGFYTESNNIDNIDDLVHFLLKYWNGLSTTVTETEVFKAKSVLKTKLVAGLDSTVAVANDIGSKLLINDRRPSVDEIYRKIDKVSASSVQAWAQNALWDQDIAVTGTGQIEALFDYNRLRNDMSMLRW